jgi:hypothetical protein
MISRLANNCHSAIGWAPLICAQTWNMKNCFIFLLLLLSAPVMAQTKEGSLLRPAPANHEVKQAIEVESLFPMFFTPMTQILEEFSFAQNVNNVMGLTAPIQFILRCGYVKNYPGPVSLRRPVEWFVKSQ